MVAFRIFLVVTLVQLTLIDADTSGLRASPPSAQEIDTKLTDTVRSLDSNGNGKVDQSELVGFAKSQGLSSDEILTDFKELDVNKDGALDSSEIGPLFGATEVAETPSVAAKPAAEVAVASVAAPAESKVPKRAEAAEAAPATVDADDLAPRAEDTMDLDVVALQRDAQEQAGGVMASRLAQRAQVLLARSVADEQKADAFDVEVRTLRGNATALAQTANHETREAARMASSAVSEKSLARLKKLQEQVAADEVAASEHRQQAKKAMEQVRQAQASLRAG